MGIKQDGWLFQNKRTNKVHESKTKAEATHGSKSAPEVTKPYNTALFAVV